MTVDEAEVVAAALTRPSREAELEAVLREWVEALAEVREAQAYIGRNTPTTSPKGVRAGRAYMRLSKAESDLEILAAALLARSAEKDHA